MKRLYLLLSSTVLCVLLSLLCGCGGGSFGNSTSSISRAYTFPVKGGHIARGIKVASSGDVYYQYTTNPYLSEPILLERIANYGKTGSTSTSFNTDILNSLTITSSTSVYNLSISPIDGTVYSIIDRGFTSSSPVKVARFSPEGNLLSQLEFPQEIRTGPIISHTGELYFGNNRRSALNSLTDSIAVYSAEGTHIRTIYRDGAGNEFQFIRNFTLDKNGNLYISADNKITVYSTQGEWLRDVYLEGFTEAPNYLAADSQGNMYTAMLFSDSISKFDPQGRLIAKTKNYPLKDLSILTSAITVDDNDTLYISRYHTYGESYISTGSGSIDVYPTK